MTILGDKAQTLDDHARDVCTFLPRIFGREIRMICMNKSYRNTIEISEYANKIAGITEIELFERHGKEVEEKTFAAFEEALEAAAEKFCAEKKDAEETAAGERAFETAALLTTTQEQAEYAYAYLKKRFAQAGIPAEKFLSCIDRDSTRFCKGLTVTTFYFAKGLEFDEVVMLCRKNERTLLHRQAEYICATRALHELSVFRYER